MTAKFTIKNNEMLFWRLGNMNAVKQKHFGKEDSHQPPTSRGIWCFPFPFHDYFFVYHQWESKLPKKFSRDIGEERNYDLLNKMTEEEVAEYWKEKDLAMKKVQSIYKPTKFWYGKQFYSHINVDGQVSYDNWYLWDSVKFWASEAQKHLYHWEDFGNGQIFKMKYSSDHLEIFIPNYK